MNRMRLLLPVIGYVLLTMPGLHAQLQIKGGTFNKLHGTGVPVDPDGTPPVVTPQFAGKGETTASSGPIDTTPGNPNDVGSIPPDHYDRYPAGKQVTGITVTGGIVLRRSSFGGSFASGVPRYSFGDEIERPELASNGIGSVDPSYWRTQPVEYGEIITQPGGAPATPLPALQVTVETSSNSERKVTVSGVHEITRGGTLLGARVLQVMGDTITLAKDADQTITSPTLVEFTPPHAYYYSPHANRVFAHQAGRVSIMWMTAQPVNASGIPDPAGTFAFKAETFNVSSGTSRPVQRIFWTERTFNGPKANIPTGRIVTVNPVYNTFFPQEVEEEYEPVGFVPADPSASPPAELRTLWFENTAGLGQLRAYNQEGRIFVEYLGALQSGGGSVHEFLGADIVEVVQVAEPTIVTVNLGEQLIPHNITDTIPANADELVPSAVLNLGRDGITYYGTSTRSDGQPIHHAQWENDNPDRVAFYWLEERDAEIHFEAPGVPNLGIEWPAYLNKYLQVWPGDIGEYAGITVGDLGSTPATGVEFSGGNIPTVVFQDDPTQSEVRVDATASQRLVADFRTSSDQTNRALLKFSSGGSVWYQRVFVQSDGLVATGPGGAPTLTDRDANGSQDLINSSVVVGARIDRPGDLRLDAGGSPIPNAFVYELAGFIAEGDGYHAGAYEDPFAAGVEAAGAGAIIPVNAVPGENEFRIWWFEKIEPPDSKFEPFFVPSKSGRYTVSYPAGPDQIVLASNGGSGDLSSVEAIGEIYVQNNRNQPGYNPNEEHALMRPGPTGPRRAFALRDDLNVTSGPAYTSEPLVLVSYLDESDSRPAMRVFEVLREIDLNDDDIEDPGDILFDYPVTAGAPVPSPMPMRVLPLPVRPDGLVPNREVLGSLPDPAPDGSAPALYDAFTTQDRKGFTLVYRGPHAGGAPTMGMQFYYPMQETFFIPGLGSQPAVGTVLPYLRPDGVTGTLDLNAEPLTVTYRPEWPEAVAELRIGETLTLPKFGLPQVRGQSSAEILYQQSIAIDGTVQPSVTLHDPTRAKMTDLKSQGL